MYQPPHFSNQEWAAISELISENSFATVLSFPENEKPYVNHLPIILSPSEGDDKVLIGHMAKRNPQWKHFVSQPEAMMIFHGPHTYITPQWYKSGRDVPTWNYAVVHLHGKIELLEGFDQQLEILKALTEKYEGSVDDDSLLPEDLQDKSALESAIISFKFFPKKIEAKFKLSQNRPVEDREGVIEGLQTRTDDNSKAIRQLMLKNT